MQDVPFPTVIKTYDVDKNIFSETTIKYSEKFKDKVFKIPKSK